MKDMTNSENYKLRSVEADRKAVCEIAVMALDALAKADAYLDGFVWLADPEASELEVIKAASKAARAVWQKRFDDAENGPTDDGCCTSRTCPICWPERED